MNEPTIEEIKRQFSDALAVIVQLTKERDDEKKWSEELAKAVCEMEDVLGFKQDQTDEQGAMIPTFGPWKERVRDLLAKEGELGDMKEERDQLAAKCLELDSIVRRMMAWEDDDRSPSIDAAAKHALSGQCGVGWLSPEKKKVLVEACSEAWNAFDNGKRKHHKDALSGKCILGCQACAIEKLKQALESCK